MKLFNRAFFFGRNGKGKIPRKIKMIKDRHWKGGYIPSGLESIEIYPGNGIYGTMPTRVFFRRNGVLGERGVVGLPIGIVPIFDLQDLVGYYEEVE